MEVHVDESEDPTIDDAEGSISPIQRNTERELHVDESEDPAIDDAEGSINPVQRNTAATLDGMESDDGPSLSQGTQDTEQDHQGGPVDPNQQLVEPNGHPGGAQEEGDRGGRFGLDDGLMVCPKNFLIMDFLSDPSEGIIEGILNAFWQHPPICWLREMHEHGEKIEMKMTMPALMSRYPYWSIQLDHFYPDANKQGEVASGCQSRDSCQRKFSTSPMMPEISRVPVLPQEVLSLDGLEVNG